MTGADGLARGPGNRRNQRHQRNPPAELYTPSSTENRKSSAAFLPETPPPQAPTPPTPRKPSTSSTRSARSFPPPPTPIPSPQNFRRATRSFRARPPPAIRYSRSSLAKRKRRPISPIPPPFSSAPTGTRSVRPTDPSRRPAQPAHGGRLPVQPRRRAAFSGATGNGTSLSSDYYGNVDARHHPPALPCNREPGARGWETVNVSDTENLDLSTNHQGDGNAQLLRRQRPVATSPRRPSTITADGQEVGFFVSDNGFGDISDGLTSQSFYIINGQSKVAINNTHTETIGSEGSVTTQGHGHPLRLRRECTR